MQSHSFAGTKSEWSQKIELDENYRDFERCRARNVLAYLENSECILFLNSMQTCLHVVNSFFGGSIAGLIRGAIRGVLEYE